MHESPAGEETTSVLHEFKQAPKHLNSTGCYIKYVEGKGRGVFAGRKIAAHIDLEISPVLLFTSAEYEAHGRHTVLDHYTFNWRDGRMALALGLGSLFNHSPTPNVSYKLEPETESIRYTTTRTVMPDEELCIFYGHSLWFQPADAINTASEPEVPEDGWGGLSRLENDDNGVHAISPFSDGNPNELVPEDELPFTRLKLIDDEAEDELDAVQTEPAWVVDIPEPKVTSVMLKWLKQSGYDTPSLMHLKRIRKSGSSTTLLLASVSTSPMAPRLPEELNLPEPFVLQVPRSAALTPLALKHKVTFWPTVYAPRKKHELEPWTRGRTHWAWKAMSTVAQEAKAIHAMGEIPIVAHVPVPYDELTMQTTQLTQAITAHDTRMSASHPLRHALMNLVRKVADERAYQLAVSSASRSVEDLVQGSSPAGENGAHYLLTSLTLFISHEPCIMCSMALLHSRVKEIFYLYPMEKTGGCGGAACLPKLPGVNHRFGIGKWKTKPWLGSSEIEVDDGVDA